MVEKMSVGVAGEIQSYSFAGSEGSQPTQRAFFRMADIENGNLTVPYIDHSQPMYFENRDFVFVNKDDPIDYGTMGVWKWNAIPNMTDESRDYVTSEYQEKVKPIQLVVINDTKSLDEVIEKLLQGTAADVLPGCDYFFAEDYHSTHKRTIEVLYTRESLLIHDGNNVRLANEDPQALVVNVDTASDFLSVTSHGVDPITSCMLYKSIYLPRNYKTRSLKSTDDAVKEILLSKLTGADYRHFTGCTRKEGSQYLEFTKHAVMNKTVFDEIAKKCGISNNEAENIVGSFINDYQVYLNGLDVDTEILRSIVESSPTLYKKCVSAIEDQWKADNAEKVASYENRLSDLQAEADKIQTENISLQTRNTELQKTIDQSLKDIDVLQAKKTESEKLAENIGTLIEEKISSARSDVADFLAEYSMYLPATAPVSSAVPVSGSNNQSDAAKVKTYIVNNRINGDERRISVYSELIDLISDNLETAGVNEEFTTTLAGYMYAASIASMPVLLAGPYTETIADAFSYAVTGKHAIAYNCSYDNSDLLTVFGDNGVVIIHGVFDGPWTNEILSQLTHMEKRFYFIDHPFTDDLSVEPYGLVNYFLPVFTEDLMENEPYTDFERRVYSNDYRMFKSGNYWKDIYPELRKSIFRMPLRSKQVRNVLSNEQLLLKHNGSVNFAPKDAVISLLPLAVIAGKQNAFEEWLDKKSMIDEETKKKIKGYLNR